MHALPRRATAATVAVALGFATLGLLASPAGAASAPAREQVSLMLASPDTALLHSLATRGHGASAAQLAAVRPSAARRARVESVLRTLGFTVTAVGPWRVTATADAARVRAVFGSARAVHPGSWRAQALPGLPTALHGLVTGVFGGDDHRAAARPLASAYTYLTGGLHPADLLAPYGSAQPALPAGRAPPTIATIQLSGWDERNLTTYAAAAGLPDPLADGAYTQVPVDGAAPNAVDLASAGDGEVALDQETLLAAAPEAHQRAYFAPNNSPAGYADALYAVGDDASDQAHDGYHLTALSLSWGSCESGPASDPYYVTMEQALAYVAASGVTVFAASGDNGAYACSGADPTDHSLAVDYPASSPSVVAVGGTTLDPTTLLETAWAGSGGGQSTLWARPSWQSGVGLPGTGRLVPDIALSADPHPGLATYIARLGGWYPVGGTSESAPLAAAMLTNTLAAGGYTYGIGDIHPALYAAPTTAFRDIVAGANTGQTFLGPGLPAGPGYDEVTGLGAPLWSTLQPSLVGSPHLAAAAGRSGTAVPLHVSAPGWASYPGWGVAVDPGSAGCAGATAAAPPASVTAPGDGVHTLVLSALDAAGRCHLSETRLVVDDTAPVVTAASVALANPTRTGLVLSWAAQDGGSAPSGVRQFRYTLTRNGQSTPVIAPTATTATRVTLAGAPGATYTLTVRARDFAGNLSAPVVRRLTVPVDDTTFGFSPYWARTGGGGYFDGSAAYSPHPGASASRGATGTRYDLLVRMGPTDGEAAVYVNGGLTRVLDLYSPTTRYRVPVTVFTGTDAARTVTVRVLGRHDAASRGATVVLDGLLAYN